MNIYLNILLHFAIVLFSLACLSRLVGVLVGWALSAVTKHNIHIGHVTLVSINDVAAVSRDGRVKLTVKHVSLVSKLFHSNTMRWLGLFVGEVCLQVLDLDILIAQGRQKPHSVTQQQAAVNLRSKPFKLPPFLIYLIQRSHFRVESLRLQTQIGGVAATVFLSNGASLVSFPDNNNRFVSSHFAIDHMEMKVKGERATYLNTSFALKLNILFSHNFKTIESLKLTIDMLSIMAYESLLDLVKQISTKTRTNSSTVASVTRQRVSIYKRLHQLLAKVPKDRCLKIQNVSCSLSDLEETRNISCKFESFKEEGGHDVNGGLLENMCLNNASVYINNTDFFSIGSLKVSPLKIGGLGSEDVTISLTTHLDTPTVQWYNTELVSWATGLPSIRKESSDAAEVALPAVQPRLSVTTTTHISNLALRLFEDNKNSKKLITLSVPSLDLHHSKSTDKISLGLASKKFMLQLPIPMKMKSKLRSKLSVIQSEYHLWGQVFDFKSLTLKIQKYKDVAKINLDLQNSALEWNYHFSNLIMELMPQFLIMLPSSVLQRSNKPASPSMTFEIDCKIYELNLFLLSNEPGEVGSLVHLNKLSLVKKGNRSNIVIDDLYLHTLEKLPEIYFCNIELDESDKLLSVSRATFARDGSLLRGDIASFTAYWQPTWHRVVDACVQRTKDSILCVRDLLMYQRAMKEGPASRKPSRPFLEVIEITVNRTLFNLITSPTNQIEIYLSPLMVGISDKLATIRVKETVSILMDSHRFLTIKDVKISQVRNDKDLLETRESQSEFAQSNKALLIECQEIRVFLPHNYGRNPYDCHNPTIAMAIDEAQNCFKMLKALYRNPRLASDGEPLYADCRVDIRQLLVEFEDCEFDQKISQNYLIMQHVMRENDAEDNETNPAQSPPNTSSRTESQLNLSELADSSFDVRSSFWDTYFDFQRYYKKQASEAHEEPVKLATLYVSDLKLCVCADETLNGHDNVVAAIDSLDDGTEVPTETRFTTLWGRAVRGSWSTFSFSLRNFPSELMLINRATFRGLLCGAEAVSPNHAIRKTLVVLRKPWKNFELARGMNPLKLFFDLYLDASEVQMAWGPCLEPSYALFGQSLDKCTKKSLDPSPLLPFWDKMRNLLRGSLTFKSEIFVMKSLSEREPLNDFEYLSICSKDFIFTWTNGLFRFDGDTVIKNNTESKYGECQIVSLPRLSVSIGLLWRVPNNLPNQHWPVSPFHPKFVKPQFEDEEWDSYQDFRSLSMDLDIALKCAGREADMGGFPKVNVYSHTLKWLDTWASVVIGTVSRPVFKGKLWRNTKPRKKKLARHYRRIHFETEFDQAEIKIWSSYRKRAGAKLTIKSGKLSMTHKLDLIQWPPMLQLDPEGNPRYLSLIRRPRAAWNTEKCTAHFRGIQGTLKGSVDSMGEGVYERDERLPEHFLFSVNEVEYRQRGDKSISTESLNSTNSRDSKLYTHWMVINDVKASIDIDTRTLILAFLEQYENSRALKRDLSSEALRTISIEGEGQKKSPRGTIMFEHSPNQSNDDLLSQFDEDQVTIVTSDDRSTSSREKLAAEQACSDSDIMTRQWSVQLTNGQIAMQGPELRGFIMLTTGKCHVLGSEHFPVLRGGEFFSKFSWTCIVEHVQYFATVDEAPECHIPWLDESMITAKRGRCNSNQEPECAESLTMEIGDQEECLKGIVREVYKLDNKNCATQLQRIVSRCGCLLSFVTFGSRPIEDFNDSTENLQYTTENMHCSDLLSAFSLRHRSVEIATNTHQFKMIIDCVNNLLLRTEGSKRSSIGRLLHAFNLMQSGEEEARKTISALQKDVREILERIKDYERELYDLRTQPQSDRIYRAQKLLVNEKNKLNTNRIKLRLTISAFKEFKLKEGSLNQDQVVDQMMEVRKNEICIDDLTWTLTGECGQIPVMEVNIKGGFAYSRTVYSTNSSLEADQNSDFSSGHKFTLGHFCIKNLQNERNPQNVLFPMSDEGGNRHKYCLRVYLSQQNNPVGGIIINNHLEVNLVPLVLRFETAFWREIQKFFVGDDKKDDEGMPDYDDLDDSSSINPLNYEIRAQGSKRNRRFNFSSRKSVRSSADPQEALDEMSERSKNRFFKFVKIQQFPILISYKGSKITVNEKTVLFPDIEIKERFQTWKGLALEVKRISVPKVALSLGKLKHSYTAPIPVLASLGVGSNSSVDENVRNQEVYRFLTGSDVDAPAKKKKGLGLGSLRRSKPKKTAPPAPVVRAAHEPDQGFVKEMENPGEWEDNTLGEKIDVLKAMSEEPNSPPGHQRAPVSPTEKDDPSPPSHLGALLRGIIEEGRVDSSQRQLG